MHNRYYIERESNIHNCAYVVGVFIGYHRPKCFEHDIVVDVPRLRRTPLEITKLSFNRYFDDMTITEVTYFLLLGHICIGNMGMLGVCNRI
jgi:hypothetical protein